MGSEFEFTTFLERYTSSPNGFIDLVQNLEGGWWSASDLKHKMKRDDYMLLASELHIQNVLFELGLLSVKEVRGDKVLLGSPNWTLTQNAMKVLVQETKHEATPADLANEYLSRDGFAHIVSKAAMTVTNLFRETGKGVVCDSPFQDYLFLQLFYRFPIGDKTVRLSSYNLYKEVIIHVQRKKLLFLPYCAQSLHAFLARLPSLTYQAQRTGIVAWP
jgi:hypothetical protein